jgi:hypothetical protein
MDAVRCSTAISATWSTIVPRLRNADGSLTIHLQAGSPGKDKEANWLPASRGPFLLILGTYAPARHRSNIVEPERLSSSVGSGGRGHGRSRVAVGLARRASGHPAGRALGALFGEGHGPSRRMHNSVARRSIDNRGRSIREKSRSTGPVICLALSLRHHGPIGPCYATTEASQCDKHEDRLGYNPDSRTRHGRSDSATHLVVSSRRERQPAPKWRYSPYWPI